MKLDYNIISLDTIDVESMKIISERTKFYVNQDHSRWVYYDESNNLYYKLWNETYIRKNNVITGFLSGFYDMELVPSFVGFIFWEGVCRGYVTKGCDEYNQVDDNFYQKIKDRTEKFGYFAYDFCPQHIYKFEDKLTLVDLEGIYHMSQYEEKSSEHINLQIPGEFVEYKPYKKFIESQLYTPLSEVDFLNMKLHDGRGGKEIVTQNGKLKYVKDVVEFFQDLGNFGKVLSELKSSNWQYFNCMMAEFRHNVGDHHEMGWENMTKEYYDSLSTMSDDEIEVFLRENPTPFYIGFIKHGFHRAVSMIGRLIKGKSYIPFYINQFNYNDRYYRNPINNINYIEDLDYYGLPRNEYSICNSGVLALIGVEGRVNNNGDMDVVYSTKLRNFLEASQMKLSDKIHPFSKNSDKFRHFGCKDDNDLVYNYSTDLSGYNFADPRFYFRRMHRLMPSQHRSFEENRRIKEAGKAGVDKFLKNNEHKLYPFNRIDYNRWGFELVKDVREVLV